MSRLTARAQLPFAVEDVFAWHTRPGALERLSPPWEQVDVLAREGGIADGGRVVLAVRTGPLTARWEARHRDFVDGRQFVDEEVRGPFRRFVHTHRFAPAGAGCVVEDDVEYELPLGALGRAVAERGVRARLQRMFAYRHAELAADLARHADPLARAAGRLRVAVTGASGLIGRALCAFLSTGGHDVARLARPLDARALAGADAIVHLAGESIAGRWTDAKKRAIADSRVGGTRALAEAIAEMPRPPRVFVSASAIGFYGDRGDTPLDETSTPGDGFLADVCRAWEAAAEPAARAGVRVVHPRIGIVLTPAGGALQKMLPAFRAGGGGPVGGGRQVMSWIALDDVVYALHRAIVDEQLRGPINLTAPAPVTQREFAHALGGALRRPSSLPLPAFAVRALFGEMGEALLLAGARVLPARLTAAGFRFRHETLDDALATLFG